MIRIELPRRPGTEVAHSYSALAECLLSLHVAFDRRGHPLAESRLRALRRLDGGLRRRLEGVRRLFEADVPEIVLAWPLGAPEQFDVGLERLASSPPELVPGRDGLCEALAEYWESAFAGDWLWIEPLLREAIAEAPRRLAEHGIADLFDRLPSGAHANRRLLTIEASADASVVASRRRPVRFAPSMFVWRRIVVGADPRSVATVLYQAPASTRLLHADAAPPELVEMLSALADDTRLRVLKLIAERPRTAQELAPIVGMSTTGLSKILRKLADAGLLAGRREGYYVVYSLDAARIRSLPLVLEQFLRGSSESRAA